MSAPEKLRAAATWLATPPAPAPPVPWTRLRVAGAVGAGLAALLTPFAAVSMARGDVPPPQPLEVPTAVTATGDPAACRRQVVLVAAVAGAISDRLVEAAGAIDRAGGSDEAVLAGAARAQDASTRLVRSLGGRAGAEVTQAQKRVEAQVRGLAPGAVWIPVMGSGPSTLLGNAAVTDLTSALGATAREASAGCAAARGNSSDIRWMRSLADVERTNRYTTPRPPASRPVTLGR